MSRPLLHPKRHKVTIVGSGNWGTTLAKVVAENTRANPKIFEEDVQMWVYEETIKHPKTGEDCKLSHLINELNENVKYLEGVALPKNVIANSDIESAVKNSSILVFVLPHQFIGSTLKMLQKDGVILPYARAISCAKGVDVDENGTVRLLSNMIQQSLNIYCGALSGANIASEIAREKWSETTVAYHPPEIDSQHPTPQTSRQPSPSQSTTDLTGTKISSESASKRSDKIVLKALPSEYPPLSHENVRKLFHREYFHVQMIDDVAGVGLGGALKNVIALAAGFVDGLGWGDNAKAAVMRIGLLEEVKFGKMFFGEQVRTGTFTEQSCGIADVITSCSGGRNFRCAKMAVEKKKKVPEVEREELNGQKLQGTGTTDDVHDAVVAKLGSEREFRKAFPLFAAVYDILHSGEKDKNGNVRPHVKYEDIPRLIGRSDGERASL